MASKAFTRPSTPAEMDAARDRLVKAWPHKPGTRVRYWPIRKGRGRKAEFTGEPLETSTRTPAFFGEGGEVAVFVTAKAGYVLASHLEVLDVG
jgi:hypothetical protein